MKRLFTHPRIREYDFEDVPLGQEIWLMDEQWMADYDAALQTLEGVFEVGYHSPTIASSIDDFAIELSWYLTAYRFHEVKVLLPRDQFITCVDCPGYDLKPRVFVKGPWLTSLHLRSHSVFALADAIGVKDALAKGLLTRDKLATLRNRIDEIAEAFPNYVFISFADSLLIKSNWSAGQYDSEVRYTYDPEGFIRLLPQLQAIYQAVLDLKIYTVLTQGSNEYYEDGLLHISRAKNHVSLNSLGLPFAQLIAIDNAVRKAIKSGMHGPKELYMDRSFYHSLRFDYPRFDKNSRPEYSYQAPMGSAKAFYVAEDQQLVVENLEPETGGTARAE